MYSIIIADDHPLLLRGTKSLLELNGFDVIGSYMNGIEAMNSILVKHPNIAILDISMPGLDGLEIAEKLLLHKSKTKLILLTLHNELSMLNKAKSLGVKGYLLKDFAETELVACIKTIVVGGEYFSKQLIVKIKNNSTENTSEWQNILTPSERKIIEQIAQQKSTKEIAETFFISEKTVEAHRSNIIKKLNLPSEKNALVIWCMKNVKNQ